MVPIPYRGESQRGKRADVVRVQFDCPRCPGNLQRKNMALTCQRCGFVPKHGAD